MTLVDKDIKDLNLTDDVLIEFLKLNEEDYTLNSNEYVLIDHHDNVVGNLLPLVVALDLNKSYITCERVEVTTITYYDKILFQLFLTSGITAKLSILIFA